MGAQSRIELPEPGTVPLDYTPRSEADWLYAISDPLWRISSGKLYKIITKNNDDDEGEVVPFAPNAAQLKFLEGLHTRNVILKARQLGFCLDVSTRVLTADLRWVRIDEVKPGDELVSVDERVPGGRGSARKMRTATVEATNAVRREGHRITFADGRTVICTDQHPWLARSGKMRQPFWRAMDRKAPNAERALEVGHHVRSVCTPWNDGDFEDGWFGGMIDGEGSIAKACTSGAEINVSQRPGAVWDRMRAYAISRGYSARIEEDNSFERASKCGATATPKLCFSRMDDLFRLVGQTRPSRMIGRRFWEGKEMPGKRNVDNSAWNEIVSIEPVGMVDMIDLQTSTGTFIAEGMVSHNTTLIAILWLDHALFVPNQRVGVIAHKLTDAEVIFRDKVRFAYDNLPALLRSIMPLKKATESELLFGHNNSSIRVSTSMRSGTIHRLHISELGKIAAESPKKAREIKTGSLPAVPDTGIAIVESTAEGKSGYFFEISTRAEKRAQVPRPLGRKEFRFHFFPWHAMPQYRAPEGDTTPISPTQHAYFDSVEQQMGITLDLRQRQWYIATLEYEQAGDAESMWREYPSTPEECWQKSNAGTFYTPQLNRARSEGRIGVVPFTSHVPVNTFWDIGSGDGTAIWLHQRVGMQHRFPRFFEDWAQGYSHYIKLLRETGQVFGTHYLPHDAGHERQMQYRVGKPIELLQELAPDWNFQIVPRVSDLQHGIQLTRDIFSQCWFDEEGCKEGLAHLEAYHKKYSSRVQDWTDEPEKDDGHSEAADAFRQFAQGYDEGAVASKPYDTLARIRSRAPTQ